MQKRHTKARIYFERLAAICEKTTCDTDSHCSALFSLVQMLYRQKAEPERAMHFGAKAKLVCQKKPLLQKKLNQVNKMLEKQNYEWY